ncbi:MAG: hypothetical protein SF182_12100 [Deltaproteobacteria bacterium]|nr:hypothetical protein [Deltaproteobacteria bacterium]
MSRPRIRTLRLECRTHAWGSAARRIELVRRLGEQALDLYLSTLAVGTSRARARQIMQRNARRGRRPSAVIAALDR